MHTFPGRSIHAGISNVTASNGVEVYINANGQLGTIKSSRRLKNDIRLASLQHEVQLMVVGAGGLLALVLVVTSLVLGGKTRANTCVFRPVRIPNPEYPIDSILSAP